MISILTTIAQISIPESKLDIPMTVPDDTTIPTVLEVMFQIMGSIAILIIVIAGMLFVLSRGNAEKSGKARNAIIYAAVGLVIAMVAFAIVRLTVRLAA